MFKKIALVSALSVALSPLYAQQKPDLTVINTGSKGGGFFMESNGFAVDLGSEFNVEYVNPGNACVAAAAISKQDKNKPILFPWDSSYEAAGREQGTCPMAFTERELIRVHYDAYVVCSSKPEMNADAFISRGASYRVGHPTPGYVFKNTVEAVNKSFATAHKPVLYSTGSGQTITALANGEIEYGILESKVARQFMKSGGTCHWSLSKEPGTGLPGLAAKDPSNKKIETGYFVNFILKNADDATREKVKVAMQRAHQDPASNTYKIWNATGMKFTWDPKLSTFQPAWESSVKMYMDK